MINYKEILAEQIDECIEALGLNDYKVVIDEEVAFFTHEQILEANTIYCVIKELSGANIHGTFVIPTELHIFTEENSVEIAKSIFDYYCKNYNLTYYTKGFDIMQAILDTPEITADFYGAGDGYRGTMEVSATFLVYSDVLDIESLKVNGLEEDFTDIGFSYSGSTDTKAFAGERLTTTQIANGSIGITIAAPAKMTNLMQEALDIHSGTKSVNTIFEIEIKFLNGYLYKSNYKLVNFGVNKTLGEIPTVEYEFIK